MSPDAGVGTLDERQVGRGVVTAEVEAVRLGEGRRVVVGRRQGQPDRFILGDQLLVARPTEANVAGGISVDHRCGRFQPQRLLDGVGEQRSILGERGQLPARTSSSSAPISPRAPVMVATASGPASPPRSSARPAGRRPLTSRRAWRWIWSPQARCTEADRNGGTRGLRWRRCSPPSSESMLGPTTRPVEKLGWSTVKVAGWGSPSRSERSSVVPIGELTVLGSLSPSTVVVVVSRPRQRCRGRSTSPPSHRP